MDMGLRCWSQACPPFPQALASAADWEDAAHSLLQVRSRSNLGSDRRSFLHCCVSSSLRHLCWPHFGSPFYLKWACRQKAQAEQGAQITTPTLQAEQGTKNLTSSFPLGQTLSSAAMASTGTKAPALNMKDQAGEKIKHRELDCILLSSLMNSGAQLEDDCYWLILASFPTLITQVY